MINISGGVYYEKCILDSTHFLYGSGGRAAVALSSLSGCIHLHTYVDIAHSENVKMNFGQFGITLHTERSNKMISFEYLHGLSKPKITPPVEEVTPYVPITVTAENVLSFGMIEGNAVVDGEFVVYDPQSPNSPTLFTDNGSKAKNLAYVLNLREGRLLTKKENPLSIIDSLLGTGAVVVVLKMGCKGSVVATATDRAFIPCIKTDYVWAIGSGDVFSAVFAHYWAEERIDPMKSALKAAHATAYYCSQRVLPIPIDMMKEPKLDCNLLEFKPACHDYTSSVQVYLAGPFFNLAERWMIEEARNALRGFGFKVFSPLHEVGIGPAEEVAVKDLEGLESSQIVFAVLNGLDPGTIFEVGYAVAKKIPVIGFVQNEKIESMKMITGTGCTVEHDFVTAIYKTAWAGGRDNE